MKIKAIVSVTASAIALCAAGSASAHPSGPLEPFDAAGIAAATQIHLGGATAQDKGIVLLMRRLCAVGTMTRVQGNKQSAILCHANGGDSLPIAAGTHLVLWKNSDGGSGTGVVPVSNSVTIPFLNLASLTQAQYQNPAICTVVTIAATPDFADYKEYRCNTITNQNLAPDAGISDVEPSKLGFAPAPAPGNNALATFPGPQVLFGVPVSKNFRNALQAAQGLAVNSDTEVNMPSLEFKQIGAILGQGGYTNVNKLSDINGNVLTNPTDPLIHVCRRAEGSGTLAATRIFFLNNTCAPGVTSVVNATVSGNGDASAPNLPLNGAVQHRVVEYKGSVGVAGCLNKKSLSGRYAVGMTSMETIPGSAYTNDPVWGTDTSDWRFIKINGYAPTLLNTVQTKYNFAYEASYQHRAAGNTFGAALGGPQKTFFDKIVATNSTAVVIKELNTTFVHSFGPSGLLGVPGAVCTATKPSDLPAGVLTTVEVSANPVNTWKRDGKSCQFPRVYCETGTDYKNGFMSTSSP